MNVRLCASLGVYMFVYIYCDCMLSIVGDANTQFDAAKPKNYRCTREGIQQHFGFSLVGRFVCKWV